MTTTNPVATVIQANPRSRVCETSARGLPEKSGVLKGLSEWLRGAVAALAPVGYQDETGFHFGSPPTRPSLADPAAW
jgi:hypothetical protein